MIQKIQKTATARKVWLPKHGRWVHLVRRDSMKRLARNRAVLPSNVPATVLPVDCTGNATVSCPMLGNDQYGDCGPVMCAHVDGIRTYGQGKPGFKEVIPPQAALVAQYEKVSGGDNGTDEDMLVGPQGIWMTGIAGNMVETVADHLDMDITNTALRQFCIDWFYSICMSWSVPDDVLQNFVSGAQFLSADTPDSDNGHYSPLADIDVSGNLRLWTWGGWMLVSPMFVASVQPECFVTFSANQFNAQGYDSHGRHVSDVGAMWLLIGGDAAKTHTVVSKFPPKVAPTPAPTPIPTPTPTPVNTIIVEVLDSIKQLITKLEALL